MCVLCLEELVAALVAPEVALADREAPVEVTAERVDQVAQVALAVAPEEWVAPEGRWEDPEGLAQVVMVALVAPVTISCTIVARCLMD
jgi:hypothetical protein